jgi:hypothetical protein
MQDRFQFARREVAEGWDWLVGVTDHIGRPLTVGALVVGLPAGLALVLRALVEGSPVGSSRSGADLTPSLDQIEATL